MALSIEYLRKGEKVMVTVYLKSLAEARSEAQESLNRYGADVAVIRDKDSGGRVMARVQRSS